LGARALNFRERARGGGTNLSCVGGGHGIGPLCVALGVKECVCRSSSAIFKAPRHQLECDARPLLVCPVLNREAQMIRPSADEAGNHVANRSYVRVAHQMRCKLDVAAAAGSKYLIGN